MSLQIFKIQVPNILLFDFLEKVSAKKQKYYLFNNASYKCGIYNDLITPFCNNIRPYYHQSKIRYINRKMTYNYFITVIRQICKRNNIPFTSHIKYDRSAYDIQYYIYHKVLVL